MKSKGGNKYAITATANKLASIYYKMVKYKAEFTPIDIGIVRRNTNRLKSLTSNEN